MLSRLVYVRAILAGRAAQQEVGGGSSVLSAIQVQCLDEGDEDLHQHRQHGGSDEAAAGALRIAGGGAHGRGLA
ncbi:MAG: hypothetical protein ACYTG5_19700 [Planctomycetota bacterium]